MVTENKAYSLADIEVRLSVLEQLPSAEQKVDGIELILSTAVNSIRVYGEIAGTFKGWVSTKQLLDDTIRECNIPFVDNWNKTLEAIDMYFLLKEEALEEKPE